MRRRQVLRASSALIAAGLPAITGCLGFGTQATAPIKLNNDTTSEVFFRVNTETLDGEFWREIEVTIPDNGFKNDPWFKEMFVDEGDYTVKIMTTDETAETQVTHPSNEWDYLSISANSSGISIQKFEQ
ncbi:hypothetical protein SAMN05216559_1970 [Halomicrobium zhouii]|uniref:Uncharacterized protein n=1 Tax=Halomicrobium zhouii TaxID=767519 RepID=A0A1I6L3N9_9EURY|nr:hypothetical protein [Halomicrobium zhouii]SFR98095.1 hypothetical protein SAMN05216559_1970 [Halomicrobium zhouii]